ncbi:MAG: caspase family protein [Bacteroidota bacterium]
MKVFLILLCCLCLWPDASAATLHLIAVADTQNASLGKACRSNLERIDKQLALVEKYTALSINKVYITGSEVITDSIIAIVQRLNCSKQDVVLFHYSGHGINRGSTWPDFLIPGRASLSLGKVRELLQTKSPRLLIALADACNGKSRHPTASRGEASLAYRPRVANDIIQANYQRLFCEAEGSIVACSSQVGSSSYYNPYLGGYFTLSLMESMVYETKESREANWLDVLQAAKEMTSQTAQSYGKQQIPVFAMYPGECAPMPYKTYIVQKHDTLFQIAKTHETTALRLKEWNALEADLIRVGDVLKIYTKQP